MDGSPPPSSSSSSSNINVNNGVHLHPDGYATRKPRFTRRRKTTTIRRHVTIVNDEGEEKDIIISDGWLGVNNGNSDISSDSSSMNCNNKVESISSVSFSCGITAGVLQAGLFNPFDRALYLSITNQVPFLRAENFRNPYSGFMQSVGHRALSSGLYYPLENFFCSLLLSSHSDHLGDMYDNNTNINNHNSSIIHLHPAFANFLAGTLAGSANALIVNPITAIKYKSWGREVNRGMLKESMEMFRKGGLRPFTNGLAPTVLRDLCFGGTYTFLRLELQYLLQLTPEQQWGANMAAAALATVVSAPFNLVRNVQYATRSREKADTISKILEDFVREARSHKTSWQSARYIQNRLRIGWGTVRVAVGMAFGHLVYDNLMGLYEDFHEDNQRTLELERRRNELQRLLLENDDDDNDNGSHGHR